MEFIDAHSMEDPELLAESDAWGVVDVQSVITKGNDFG